MVASNIAVSHAETGLVAAEVIRSEQISPHFVRITLGGESLQTWRHLGFDQWFRLALPMSSETSFDGMSDRFDVGGYLRYLTLPKATKPVIRNYTVRAFRQDTHELDIDFVVHGTAGVAGPWAATLPTGATVGLIDQGCGYRAVEGANEVILAGEESAMPAVLGILRDLPADTAGNAVIEIPDAADRQPTVAPDGVDVHWVVRRGSGRPGAAALEKLRSLPAPAGAVSAFIAGEQQLATGGRRHLVKELGIEKSAIDFSGYWRQK